MGGFEETVAGLIPAGNYRLSDLMHSSENILKVSEYEDLESGECYYLSAVLIPIPGQEPDLIPFKIEADGPIEALQKAEKAGEEAVSDISAGEYQEAGPELSEDVKNAIKERRAAEDQEEPKEDESREGTIFDLQDLK